MVCELHLNKAVTKKLYLAVYAPIIITMGGGSGKVSTFIECCCARSFAYISLNLTTTQQVRSKPHLIDKPSRS